MSFLAINHSILSNIIPSPADIELILVKVYLPFPLCICVVYVLPNSPSSYVSSTLTYLSGIVHNYENCIIVGILIHHQLTRILLLHKMRYVTLYVTLFAIITSFNLLHLQPTLKGVY